MSLVRNWKAQSGATYLACNSKNLQRTSMHILILKQLSICAACKLFYFSEHMNMTMYPNNIMVWEKYGFESYSPSNYNINLILL